MISPPQARFRALPLAPWLTVLIAGVAGPAIAMLVLVDASASVPPARFAGPVMAIALMSVGMIAAAAAGRFGIGVGLALLAGTGLVLAAAALGMAPLPHVPSAGLALVLVGISFAARGALFARSASDKGWWIALAVVAGEAAVLFTASAAPGALPGWLLALLPAQWASAALGAALTGTGAAAAWRELLALAGTAAATLLVAALWPRRWPYLVMFTVWLGLSALVWHGSAASAPPPAAGHAAAIRPGR